MWVRNTPTCVPTVCAGQSVFGVTRASVVPGVERVIETVLVVEGTDVVSDAARAAQEPQLFARVTTYSAAGGVGVDDPHELAAVPHHAGCIEPEKPQICRVAFQLAAHLRRQASLPACAVVGLPTGPIAVSRALAQDRGQSCAALQAASEGPGRSHGSARPATAGKLIERRQAYPPGWGRGTAIYSEGAA